MATDELKAAAWEFSRVLSSLLNWAEHPDPAPLSGGWFDAYKSDIGRTFERVAANIPSNDVEDEVFNRAMKAFGLANEFSTLLHAHPSLSVKPVHEWPVKAYIQLFDDLASHRRWFYELGELYQTPTAADAYADNSGTTETSQDAKEATGGVFADTDWSEFRAPKKWMEILGCRPRTWSDWKSKDPSSFRNQKLGNGRENNKLVSIKIDFVRQHRANFTR